MVQGIFAAQGIDPVGTGGNDRPRQRRAHSAARSSPGSSPCCTGTSRRSGTRRLLATRATTRRSLSARQASAGWTRADRSSGCSRASSSRRRRSRSSRATGCGLQRRRVRGVERDGEEFGEERIIDGREGALERRAPPRCSKRSSPCPVVRRRSAADRRHHRPRDPLHRGDCVQPIRLRAVLFWGCAGAGGQATDSSTC